MGDIPSRGTLGDYGIGATRCLITHGFQPANPIAFNIKNSVLVGLRENQYDGGPLQDPYEHLSRFYESCLFCCPDGVTEDQKKLQLFSQTLTGRARDWLHALPNGIIHKWDELEEKFLKRFFPLSKLLEKRAEISGFKQGDIESLYDAWERFRLLLKRCPPHGFDIMDQMQIFTHGMNVQTRMLLDVSAGGSIRVKTDLEVQTLIESMTHTENCVEIEKKKGVFEVSESTVVLANQAAMNNQLEDFTKHVTQQQQPLVQQATNHHNLSYSNTNTFNPLLPNPQLQQQQPRKPSAFEEFVKMTKDRLDEIKATQEAERKNNEASRKMFETQIGQMAKQLAEQSRGGFSGNTKDNPKNESCNAIELRSKKVLPPLVPKKGKSSVVVVEKQSGVVEKNDEEVVVEKEKEHGVVENKNSDGVVENEKKDEEKYEPLIDKNSMLRKSKSQLLKEGDKPQEVPSYVKLPYPHLSKKKEKEGEKVEKLRDANSILRKSKSQLLKDGDKPQVIPDYVKMPYPRFSKNKENVKHPKNKNCKVVDLRTRKVLKPMSLESTNRKVDKLDGEDEVGNEQHKKNKKERIMLVESKWKYPP